MDLEEQVERAYGQYSSRESPIGKNSFMTSMKYQNDVWTDCLEELNAQLINCRPRFSITRYAKLLRAVLAASTDSSRQEINGRFFHSSFKPI